jgi:hypothetical protein
MEPNMLSPENDEQHDPELSALLRQFREVCPDPEPSVNFTPGVWRGIEARRKSGSLLRRWAEVCLAATVALALLLTFFVIPRFQASQTETNALVDNYVDVLRAADPANEVSLLPGTETAVEPVRELE